MLRGRCVDALGNPLPQCEVLVEPRVGDTKPAAGAVLETTSGRDGRFALPLSAAAANGSALLVVTLAHRDFAPRILSLDLGQSRPGPSDTTGQLPALADVVFETSHAVELRVVDAERSLPLSGRVEAVPLAVPEWLPPGARARCRQSTELVEGLAYLRARAAVVDGGEPEWVGTLSLRAEAPGHVPASSLVRPGDSAVGTALERATTIRGRLVDAVGLGVRATRAELAVHGSGPGEDWTVVERATEDGSFVVGRIPAAGRGTLTLTLTADVGSWAAGTRLQLGPVALGSLTQGPILVGLPDHVVATGKVVRAGRPVEGARVRVLAGLPAPANAPSRRWTVAPVVRTDARGRFAIRSWEDRSSAAFRGRIPTEISSSAADARRVDLAWTGTQDEPQPGADTMNLQGTNAIGLLQTAMLPRTTSLAGVALQAGRSGAPAPTVDRPVALFRVLPEAPDAPRALAAVPTATTRTGPDGRFRFDPVPRGAYRVRLGVPGTAPVAWSPVFGARVRRISPETILEGGTVETGVPAGTRWVELRPTDQPRPSRFVEVHTPSTARTTPGAGGTHDATDPAVVRFDHVPPGTWDLLYHSAPGTDRGPTSGTAPPAVGPGTSSPTTAAAADTAAPPDPIRLEVAPGDRISLPGNTR